MHPRLAVAYDTSSASPLQIFNALSAACELVFVVDSSALTLGPMGRMLARFGTVIDLAGKSAEASEELKAARPDGVVAFTDSQLQVADAIASSLGLPGNGPEVTARFVDKRLQRATLQAAGIPVPRFAELPARSTPEEVEKATQALRFPAVLKPRGGTGSRDTHHMNSREQLVALYEQLDQADALSNEDFLIEEHLPDRVPLGEQVFGDYISVESVAVQGRVRHLAVTGKFPLEPPYRETGNFLPAALNPEMRVQVCALAGLAATALGISYGCLHTEVKLTAQGPRLIESNARVAGGGIDDIFVMRYGESLLKIAGMAALGIEPAGELAPRTSALPFQLYLQPPRHAERIVRIGDLSPVHALRDVSQVYVKRKEGEKLDWREGSQAYVLFVRGSANDHDQLAALRTQILSELDVEFA